MEADGRRALIGAAAVLSAVVALGVAVGVLRGDGARGRDAVRDEARLAYPGAELVSEEWTDEDHGRYIDTGGYDDQAGWTFEYELPAGATFVEICDFYEQELESKGWRSTFREDEGEGRGHPASCDFARGDGDDAHEIELGMDLSTYESFSEAPIYKLTVDYRLPWETEPSYDT